MVLGEMSFSRGVEGGGGNGSDCERRNERIELWGWCMKEVYALGEIRTGFQKRGGICS